MAYSNLNDIRERIGETALIQLTDDEITGEIAESRVTEAISDADAEIDGYIGSRHRTPLDPVPAAVRKISAEIAIYNLYARRDAVPENRLERYRSAVQFLEGVASGRISLGQADPDGSPPESNAPEFSGENPARAFTRSSMADY